MADVVPLGGPRVRRDGHDLRPLLVRGELGDQAIDRVQCTDFLRRFPSWGRYGLSAYQADDLADVDRLGADQLERFATLSVFSVSTLVSAGFEVVPTFRRPHMTVAFTGDIDERLLAFANLRIEVRTNPYHR
ncbi:MAG: hypothetical protein ACR2HM_06160 [Acidimicrobiales bacterium]